MKSSMELLQKALNLKTVSEWGRVFKIDPSAITNARRNGRLSPALAGNFAIELGEEPGEWIAIAVLEGERKSPLTERLRASMFGGNGGIRTLDEALHPILP